MSFSENSLRTFNIARTRRAREGMLFQASWHRERDIIIPDSEIGGRDAGPLSRILNFKRDILSPVTVGGIVPNFFVFHRSHPRAIRALAGADFLSENFRLLSAIRETPRMFHPSAVSLALRRPVWDSGDSARGRRVRETGKKFRRARASESCIGDDETGKWKLKAEAKAATKAPQITL